MDLKLMNLPSYKLLGIHSSRYTKGTHHDIFTQLTPKHIYPNCIALDITNGQFIIHFRPE